MHTRRNHLAFVLAALALVLQASWPLLSQAQPKDASLHAVVCSVQGGVQTIDLSGGEAPAGDAHEKCCKLCMVGGERAPALLFAPADAFPVPRPALEAPAASPAAALRSAAAPPAQPRAPPFPG